MDWLDALIIIAAGTFAGFVNVVAGGGSILTLPVLIFMGLPPATANATNRIAIFSQNIFGVLGFRSKGVSVFPFSLYVALAASAGAVLGAWIAVDIKGDVFNKILAIVILLIVVNSLFGLRKQKQVEQLERLEGKAIWLSLIAFFLIGIYGGFIQAGTGFLIMAALTQINKLSLVKTNSIKVFVVLIYTSTALAIFIWLGQINYLYGVTLAIGNSMGGWIGSRWSVSRGDKWIKWVVLATSIIFAIKLFFEG